MCPDARALSEITSCWPLCTASCRAVDCEILMLQSQPKHHGTSPHDLWYSKIADRKDSFVSKRPSSLVTELAPDTP
eukprot:8177791-Karenia_brevis.AAC.1